MAGRIRNTKALAQRIEREYFKRTYGIPRWRLNLTLLLVAAGAGWAAWRVLAHDHTAFSSGPVTAHHASFGKNCAACHAGRSMLGTRITNEACEACHDGPIHHAQQTSTPDCAECHIEHRGPAQLLGAGGKACVACHSNLKVRQGMIAVAAHIESIAKGHPEFTALRPGHRDPGGIKFNHKVHLKPELKGPGGSVQLDCADCHRPTGIEQPWPYGRAEPGVLPAKANVPGPRSRLTPRAYMQPVNYYEHCSSCHPLQFDRRIGDTVPHKKPEIVVAFLEPQFRKYIVAHPEELKEPSVQQRLPRMKSAPQARNTDEWVSERVAESERLLWSKTCAECHSLSGVQELPAPRVREANITVRWLPGGNFDHASHMMLDCAKCHTGAPQSERTSEVLIPGIKSCQTCHNPEGGDASARADCAECHQYHDWSKEKPRRGRLKVPQS
jgi:hypothetical protein